MIAFVRSGMIVEADGGTTALAFGIATLTGVNSGTSREIALTTLLGGWDAMFGPAAGPEERCAALRSRAAQSP